MLEEDDENGGITKEDEAMSASSVCNVKHDLKGS